MTDLEETEKQTIISSHDSLVTSEELIEPIVEAKNENKSKKNFNTTPEQNLKPKEPYKE